MRWTPIGWCVMAAVLALSTPAIAHVPTTTPPADLTPTQLETLAAAAPSMDGLGTLLTAVAVAMTLIARRRRVLAAACIALLLLLVAFEAGVHSVHHLLDQPGGQCVVASASAHIGGVPVATVAVARPVEAAMSRAVTATGSPTARPATPDLGRAPPLA